MTHVDLSCSSTEMLVMVESFPQIIDRPLARFRSRIQQADDIRLKVFSNRVEEPAMRVDLLGVLLFEAEDELDGD